MHLRFIFFFLSLGFFSTETPYTDVAASEYLLDLKQGPYSVGYKVQHHYDYLRTFKDKIDYLGNSTEGEIARPVQISIWYPALVKEHHDHLSLKEYFLSFATELDFSPPDDKRKAEAIETFQDYMISHIGESYSEDLWKTILKKKMIAFMDAEPIDGSFPLVIYAPGNPGMSFENYRMFEYLASHGFVIASIPSFGDHSKTMQNDLTGIEAQTRDMEFVMAVMRNFPNVDKAKTAVMGFSWGGLTNVPFAMRNRKVDALITLDGAVTMEKWVKILRKSPYYNFRKFQAPVMVIIGAPADWYKVDFGFYKSLKYNAAYLIRALKLPHSQFRSMANQLNVYLRKDLAQDYVKQIDLSYTIICCYVHHFLDAYLKNSHEGFEYLKNTTEENGIPEGLFTIERKKPLNRPPMDEEFFGIVRDKGVAKAIEIFNNARKIDPDVILFNEEIMNNFGYQYLNMGKIQTAIELFRLNVQAYPGSADVYDSLADAYLKNGDLTHAINNYEESLRLNPENQKTRDLIKELRKKIKK
jgi:tetratricopeptide (TPR) repeat protein